MAVPAAHHLNIRRLRPVLLGARVLIRRLREVRAGSERGQSLVVTTVAMVAVLGMAGLALDTASWYQRNHQAQVAADAAALAAANCMANVGVTTPTFTNQCTTTTDAANVATTYAADNGYPIQASDVSFGNGSVTVTTSSSAPAIFATLFGIKNATSEATSQAKWTAPAKSTCDAGMESSGACYFAFAMDQSCPDVGMTLENVGKVKITGGIWSNSDLETVNADNNSSWGNVYFGNGNLCSWIGASVSNGDGPLFTSGPTAEPPVTTWPRDYSSLLPCSSTGTYQCSGPNHTPSYCTQAAPAFGLNLLGQVTSIGSGAVPFTVSNNQVYCAYGTSANHADPRTWNGVILGTVTSNVTDSFLGGEVVLTTQGNASLTSNLSTSLGNLLVYANDTLIPAANIATQGQGSIKGDVFAPNGGISASSAGGSSWLSFLEGQQVVVDAQGDMTGEGPQTGSGGSSSLPGSDTLAG